ncbi:LysR family transcriptional regulator [Novosphingobium panipatense]|uniref:LysR family transcriptional regulator n=1 Tax=Novosphingobium TaxID=165696 RepID=UPI001304B702|nr:LysR family transcriptional regulator [Novosphingobium sp. HII-3]
MDLRQLRHFIAVAELGNFSRAAERVCLTQPALTRSIKTLEDDIDARLFDRRSNGVELTPAGGALLEHARLMVNEHERAQQRIALAKRGLGEELVVALCPFQAEMGVRPIIAAFTRENPDISMRVVEGHVAETVPALMERKVDVVFTTVPPTTMVEKLVYERIRSTPCSIYAASDHPLARRSGLTPSELSRWAWATLDQKHALDALRSYFATGNSGMPAAGIRSGCVSFLREMVVKEGMLGVLPDAIMAKAGAVALHVERPPRPLRGGLLFRADAEIKQSAERFADKLRKHLIRQDAEDRLMPSSMNGSAPAAGASPRPPQAN